MSLPFQDEQDAAERFLNDRLRHAAVAEYLGSGCTREVYKLRHRKTGRLLPYVLKYARSAPEANRDEHHIYNLLHGHPAQALLARVYDISGGGYFLIQERVRPYSAARDECMALSTALNDPLHDRGVHLYDVWSYNTGKRLRTGQLVLLDAGTASRVKLG